MHRKDSIQELTQKWRDGAETLRRYGGSPSAVALEACADDLEEALRNEDRATLTLQRAADESGYSADHLGRLVRDGKIPNAGRPGSPQIARCHLPRKAAEVAERHLRRETSNRQVVQSIIDKGVA